MLLGINKKHSHGKCYLVYCLFWLLCCSAGIIPLIHSYVGEILPETRFTLTNINPEGGFCFIAATGLAALSSHAHPSAAKLFENGIELPFANSFHDDIRKVGLGRFSFWHSYIYFSSSDNTDPRINQKTYEVRKIRNVPSWLNALGVASLLLGLCGLALRGSGYIFFTSLLNGVFRKLTQRARQIAGIFLVILAIVSNLTLPSYDPYSISATQGIPAYNHVTQPPLRGWRDTRLKRLPGEGDFQFVQRLGTVVSESFAHCDKHATFRIIDSLSTFFFPSSHEIYGLLLPENGCGFCHQSAFILAKALLDNSIQASVFGLNGHVVTLVHIGNENWLIDPDAGIGPFRYSNEMWMEIKPQYTRLAGETGAWINDFEHAFMSAEDDFDFTPMETLLSIERKQRVVITGLEVLSLLTILAGLLLLLPTSWTSWIVRCLSKTPCQ